MPKVGNMRIDNINSAGCRLTFIGEVHVDSSGVFKLAISNEDIAENAEKILYNPGALSNCVKHGNGYALITEGQDVERTTHLDMCRYASEITFTHAGYHQQKHPTLRSYTSAALDSFMKYVVACTNAVSVTEEYVILYKFDPKWCCYVTSSGEVRPNAIGEPEQSGQWRGTDKMGYNRDHDTTYRAGFGADVYLKVTRTKGTVQSVSYEFVTGSEEKIGESGKQLCQFNLLNMLVDSRWDSSSTGELPRGVVEIPYTEEAAAFFCKVLLAMCKLCNSLEDYLGTPEKVAAAISANTLSLPQV